MKKIIIAIIGLLVVGVGVLFAINGKDNYDASKYSAKISDGLKVGSHVSFNIPDQFDKPHHVGDDAKIIIFTFAKATGHTVKGYLNAQPKDYLPSRHAYFIADISPMPVVIRNTFALPDLKKSPYSVLLIYDKNIAKQIRDDAHKDKIIIAFLEHNVIKDIKYIDTAKELKEILD